MFRLIRALKLLVAQTQTRETNDICAAFSLIDRWESKCYWCSIKHSLKPKNKIRVTENLLNLKTWRHPPRALTYHTRRAYEREEKHYICCIRLLIARESKG
jgi:hypothetical protein